jgi:hypothetical protein
MKCAHSILILFVGVACGIPNTAHGQLRDYQLPRTVIRLDIIPLFVNSVNVSVEKQLDFYHRGELTLGYIHPNKGLHKIFSDNFGSPEMMHYGGRLQATYKWIKKSYPGGRAKLRGLQFETVYKQFKNRILYQKAPPPGTSVDDYKLLLSHQKTQLGLRYQISYQFGKRFSLEYGYNFGIAAVREHTDYGGVQRGLSGPYLAPVEESEKLPRDNDWYLRPLLRVFLRAGIGIAR